MLFFSKSDFCLTAMPPIAFCFTCSLEYKSAQSAAPTFVFVLRSQAQHAAADQCRIGKRGIKASSPEEEIKTEGGQSTERERERERGSSCLMSLLAVVGGWSSSSFVFGSLLCESVWQGGSRRDSGFPAHTSFLPLLASYPISLFGVSYSLHLVPITESTCHPEQQPSRPCRPRRRSRQAFQHLQTSTSCNMVTKTIASLFDLGQSQRSLLQHRTLS